MHSALLATRPGRFHGGMDTSRASPIGRCPQCGQRHRLNRRRLLQTAAGASLALGAGLHRSGFARAQSAGTGPKPVPGGIDLGDGNVIHVYDYSAGYEPSSITDFRGFVGIQHLRGWGTVTTGGGDGMATPSATGDRLAYDTDMRFMQGIYVGEDGLEHEGTFGFI